MDPNVYAVVAQNCSAFYPDFSSGRTCPEVSRANCLNCRNFKDKHCQKDLFDAIYEELE